MVQGLSLSQRPIKVTGEPLNQGRWPLCFSLWTAPYLLVGGSLEPTVLLEEWEFWPELLRTAKDWVRTPWPRAVPCQGKAHSQAPGAFASLEALVGVD